MNDVHEAGGLAGGSDPGIDLEAALAMAGGDRALLRELAKAFADEVPRLLGVLRSRVVEGDVPSFCDAAHQLQGVMRCLHMDRALEQSRELERLGEGEADWSAIEKLLVELDTTIGLSMGALDEFLRR
ncbi:MAG: Hpt domain-containing protein [Thermoguttaceae bacterium]